MESLDLIRNVGIIAHIDAGKTSTTEAMLFYSGLTHRIGSIDDGTTVMDYLDEERTRGITIVAAAATFPWQEALIHLIDTPGHIDFTAEVERSLRVSDSAVVIFSGVEGVEAQSEKVWRQAENYHIPKLAFVNKLDRIGASFPRVLGEIREKFTERKMVPLQEPIAIEDYFDSFVDLVSMEMVTFDGDDNETVLRGPVPEEHRDSAEQRREEMIEILADESDEIATAYLEGDEIAPETLRSAIRRLTLSNKIVPVLLGSAKKRIGVQPLMRAIIDYLPSPSDVREIRAHRLKSAEDVVLEPDPDKPFAGLVFKVVASTSADLLYMRTYCGTLKRDMNLVNPRTGQKVRPKQILRLYAKNTQTMDSVGPGDIVGIIGPRDCGTGDTLCETHQMVAFERIVFPEPVVSMAIEPRYTKDKDKLSQSLELLCREDPTLDLAQDEETGQRILSGMGELHLEVNLKRLLAEFRVEARVGEPRVAYRETLGGETVELATFQKTFGDNELYAQAKVAFRPLPRGADAVVVRNSLRNAKQLPKAYVQAAERALTDGFRTGGSRGYPVIYVSAELQELTVRQGQTTEGTVVGAVLQALDQAVRSVGTRVLEPLMHLEIISPEETIGEISTHLHPRRAIIHEMVTVGNTKRLACEVPLAEMFGFGKILPKLSGGRASFTMEPCGYQELPPDVAQRIFGYL